MREVDLYVIEEDPINLDFDGIIYLTGGGGGGTSDYNELRNKPQINGVTLQGNKELEALGVSAMSVQDIERILYLD